MATITPQQPGAITYTAATSGGDTYAFASASRPVILVRNGGSTITVTLAGINQCSQGFSHAATFSCAAGDTEILVPDRAVDQTPATRGNVTATYSSVTSVTVAAVAN